MDELFRQANERLQAARDADDDEYRRATDRLDAAEAAIRRRRAALDARRRRAAAAHGDPDASHDDLVEVNAGGRVVAARRGTLCQLGGGTRLEALFGGRWDRKVQRDDEGRAFLDVDPDAFQAIVDHLHERAISPPDDLPRLPAPCDDEDRVAMNHLLEIFALDEPIDSNVLTEDHVSQLRGWLSEDESDGKLELLYRSSRDGSSAGDFHSKCDRRGCTLVALRTRTSGVVGGYSNTPWSSAAGSFRADKAFLFAFSPAESPDGIKLKLKDPTDGCAVTHGPDLGPTFGRGHDLKAKGPELSNCGCSYGEFPGGNRRSQLIEEMEVFRVSKMPFQSGAVPNSENPDLDAVAITTKESNSFSDNIKKALEAKLDALREADLETANLENSFKDEVSFIDSFASGETKDVVKLNVSGTAMATKRSTLLHFKDSVLARQFDDAVWTEHGQSNNNVKDWTPDDVNRWVASLDGVADDVADVFRDNEVTGRELLALGVRGLRTIGVTRPAAACLLHREIRRLDDAASATLVEHGPRCFAAILEYLRARRMHARGVAGAPDLPVVREGERKRFERVVGYFFPGEGAELILGVPGFGQGGVLNHFVLHFVNHGGEFNRRDRFFAPPGPRTLCSDCRMLIRYFD